MASYAHKKSMTRTKAKAATINPLGAVQWGKPSPFHPPGALVIETSDRLWGSAVHGRKDSEAFENSRSALPPMAGFCFFRP